MAPRPYVQIDAANHVGRLRAHLDRTLPDLITLPGVMAITLNGGLSRGYADDLSEIDLTLYLTPDAYERWQAGQAPLPTGIAMLDGMLYDIKIANLEKELARSWSQVELWDLSYMEILFDPSAGVAHLAAEKLIPPSPDEASGPLFNAWWYFRLAGDIWRQRGDALQGHHVLNQAVTELARALFLANGEYIPHDKWLLHMSRTLAWQPANWPARLAQAMTAAPALASVQMRQNVIASLWDEIDRHLVDTFHPEYPLQMMHLPIYNSLQLLVERRRIPVEEWAQIASLAMLNQLPFHEIASIVDNMIILDRERFLTLGPNTMYAWHYDVLEALRGDTL